MGCIVCLVIYYHKIYLYYKKIEVENTKNEMYYSLITYKKLTEKHLSNKNPIYTL